MKVELVIITGEGHDEDAFAHGLEFELSEIPRTGECINLSRPDQSGSSTFVVRAVHWALDYKNCDPKSHRVGKATVVTLECEFVLGPYDYEEHKDIR